jgi:hypothetical protein
MLYRHAQLRLAQELTRARRYQRPLTVVALRFTNEQSLDRQSGTMAEGGSNEATLGPQTQPFHVIFPLVGVVVRDALREGDIVTYDAVNDYYVMILVESTKTQAIQAVQRLMALVLQRALVVLHAGLAEFPTDGLTIEDLVIRAQGTCDHWPIHATFPRSTA